MLIEVSHACRCLSDHACVHDQNMSINRDEKLQLESDLSGMKHEVLRIREMLEMAEKVIIALNMCTVKVCC